MSWPLDYLLLRHVGAASQRALLDEVAHGAYQLEPFHPDDVARAGQSARSGIRPLCAREGQRRLTYVTLPTKLTHIMEKTQIYLPKEELDALRKAAARSGRSVADLIREAIRKVVLKPSNSGPVAIWDGEPRRPSVDHDTIHDET